MVKILADANQNRSWGLIGLTVRQKLLISYLLTGLPLTIFVIYNSWQRYQAAMPMPVGLEINDVYFFILGLALTVAFSIISGHFITKPITVLRQNFENFSNLNFSNLTPVKSGDEFELFFKKFKQMNQHLEEYTHGFEEKNNELEAIQKRLRWMVNFQKIRMGHLSILHEVSLNLNKEKDVNKILKTVLQAAAKITNSESGAIIQKNRNLFIISNVFSNLENFSIPQNLKNGISKKEIEGVLGNELSQQLFETKKSIRSANPSELNKAKQYYDLKALLVTPILDNKQGLIGLLVLVNKDGKKQFTIEDEKVTQILSSHASVAINNALSYEKEHQISQLLQKSMLPSKSFAKSLESHIDVSFAYKPATQEARVGGDFYDFIDLGKNRTACLIADVSGKGVQAATMTSLVGNTIKAFAYEGLSPDKVLDKTNKVLYNQTEASVFITAIYSVLDLNSGIFYYANAGHHPPMLYRDKTNEVTTLNQGSTPLGLLASETYELHTVNLQLSDSLVLYTDGLVESRVKGKFFGEKGLVKSISSHAPLPVNIAQKILSDVENFTGGNLTDDIALLVLKVKQPLGKLMQRLAVKSEFAGW